MGYYDNHDDRHYGFEPRPELESRKEYKRRQPKQRGAWLNSLVSSMIGGLIVLMLVPYLSGSGLLPYYWGEDTQVSSGQSNTVEQEMYQQVTSLEVSSDVIDAVEKVSNAIVGVVNIQEVSDFFNRDAQGVERGTGSGVIFDKKDGRAYIVTNYHVIENAQTVEISLANGERVEAELIGADSLTDLAVLSIDDEHVEAVAQFGDSNSIRPGETAIAIGNPLGLEFSRTVTQGIISAKERSIPISPSWEINVIQTDAAINPGNSGGALMNIQGQVIGINSLKISQTMAIGGQPIEGMGFAIPIHEALPVIESLVENGEVQRPFMGVGLEDLTNIETHHWRQTLNLPEHVKQGVVIVEVRSLSPADRGGLEELDVIVELDGQEIPNGIKLRQYLYSETSIGDTIEVKVYRDGLPLTKEVNLSESMPSGG